MAWKKPFFKRVSSKISARMPNLIQNTGQSYLLILFTLLKKESAFSGKCGSFITKIATIFSTRDKQYDL